MTVTVVAIFVIVYLGMILGGLPFVQLDRTGVALLGAIALVGTGDLTPEQAALSIHLPTLLLLFSFMVISAQMRLGGFYGWVTLRIAALPLGPSALLAAVIAAVAVLSAVFSNDIVCLAIAPVLAEACLRRGLDPVPYLLALACAANIGSAATLIGNPQNMLIGAVLKLPFGGYSLEAVVPVVLGLVALWLLLAWQMRGERQVAAAKRPDAAALGRREPDDAPFDRWQTAKGLTVVGALIVVFLFTDWPREVAALAGAGLAAHEPQAPLGPHARTRRLGAAHPLHRPLRRQSRVRAHRSQRARGAGGSRRPASPSPSRRRSSPLRSCYRTSSRTCPRSCCSCRRRPSRFSGPMLALVSTLAGNLLIVGSIANIIVVDAARRGGIAIDWRRHARTGVPVTLATLAITAAWFAWRGAALRL